MSLPNIHGLCRTLFSHTSVFPSKPGPSNVVDGTDRREFDKRQHPCTSDAATSQTRNSRRNCAQLPIDNRSLRSGSSTANTSMVPTGPSSQPQLFKTNTWPVSDPANIGGGLRLGGSDRESSIFDSFLAGPRLAQGTLESTPDPGRSPVRFAPVFKKYGLQRDKIQNRFKNS